MFNMLITTAEESKKFVDVVIPWWGWEMLIAVFVGALLIDLLLRHKTAHVVEPKEALQQTAMWIALGLSFSVVIYAMFRGQGQGTSAAIEYLSGYLIEYSLSIDNVFVWAMIFVHFKVPNQYQHRTLFWGIFGALVMRFIFIALGVQIITRFEPLLVVFGVFLIYTGIKIMRSGDEESNPSEMRTMKLFRKFVPSVEHYDGQKMFTRVNGRRFATPLLAVLVLVEVSDVVFAVDSVPAVLAVSREQFIVFASNAFAILGLRSLYFVLADMRERFVYMPLTISSLLIFVGIKMSVGIKYHIPTVASLGVIIGLLAIGVGASVRHDRRNRA